MRGGLQGRGCHAQGGRSVGTEGRMPPVRACRTRSDAARDAPGPTCHKPKTPIGRRGVSLNLHCGRPARGKRLAGTSLLFDILRGHMAAGCISVAGARWA